MCTSLWVRMVSMCHGQEEQTEAARGSRCEAPSLSLSLTIPFGSQI